MSVLLQYGDIIGAFLGAAAPISAVVVAYWINVRRKRRKIRLALKSDIEQTHDMIEQFLDKAEEWGSEDTTGAIPLKTDIVLSNAVFESLIDEIGSLSSEEVDKLIDYYRMSSHTKTGVEVFWQEYEERSEDYINERAQRIKSNLLNLFSQSEEVTDLLESRLRNGWISLLTNGN